eukprot:948137-Prorocentrum_minimum.AAC.1
MSPARTLAWGPGGVHPHIRPSSRVWADVSSPFFWPLTRELVFTRTWFPLTVDVKGNGVDVKGNGVDVEGNGVDVKGNIVVQSGLNRTVAH